MQQYPWSKREEIVFLGLHFCWISRLIACFTLLDQQHVFLTHLLGCKDCWHLCVHYVSKWLGRVLFPIWNNCTCCLECNTDFYLLHFQQISLVIHKFWLYAIDTAVSGNWTHRNSPWGALIQVIAAGGLHVVGTERHESRRIDNQVWTQSQRRLIITTSFCKLPRREFFWHYPVGCCRAANVLEFPKVLWYCKMLYCERTYHSWYLNKVR